MAGRALLVGALVSLMSCVTLTAIVTQHRFDSADRLARALVHRPHHPLFQSSMEAASFLGGEPGQIAVIVLGSAVLWRRRRRWALGLPMVMAGAGIVQLVAKWAIDRPRPNLGPWGFPSAHVLSLVVLFGCIAYVVGTSRARRGWRGLSVGVGAAIVCTVAYSRIYLEAHWLSDVLGGLSIGLAYLLVVIWLIRSSPVHWEAPVLRAAPGGSGTEGLPTVAATGASAAGPLVAATAGS